MTFLSLTRPYHRKILLTLFYILIANVLSLALPWGIKLIIDDALPRRDTGYLHVIMAVLVGILVARSLFNYLRKMTGNMTGERIVADLREKIYWHVQKVSLKHIQRVTPSQILTSLTADVNSVRQFICGDFIDFIYALMSVVLIAGVLAWMNAALTAVALVTLPVFALFYLRVLPRLKTGYQRLREANGRLSARILEVLQGMSVVRVFTAEDHEKNDFSRRQKDILEIVARNHALNVGLGVGIDFFTSLGVIGILWVGGLAVIRQAMTPGALMAFYAYIGMLFAPVIRLVIVNGSYQEARTALNRINDLLALECEIPSGSGRSVLTALRGRIAFENVSFGYAPGEQVLKDITFTAEPGEVVGIVGTSGVGKTTLISLLVRFFDPQRGTITIDGASLKDLDVTAYRRQVAVVLQDDYLFSGTIADNIRYGNWAASVEEIEEAARTAQALEFIRQFPDGFQTMIGERGTRLSHGQRQRIAIARALVRRPSILILDEATSAVDALTENAIQAAIRDRMAGRTVFIVAHRFSSIVDADKIVVLENGRVLETGEHRDLLQKKGLYSTLYLEQFRDQPPVTLAER